MQTVTFECPEEDVAELDRLAGHEDLKRADMLRRAIRMFLKPGTPRSRPNGRLSSASNGNGVPEAAPRRRRKVAA